jgi:integrase
MFTAVDDDLIRRNPCRIKGADKARRAERSVATVKQAYALADLLGARWRAFVLTAAFTGIRWGELIALRRTDIDLAARVVRVPRAFAELSGGRLVVVPPKSEASERSVTMPHVLIGELTVHLDKFVGADDAALVFLGERGGTPKRGSWRTTVKWTKRVAEAGSPEGLHVP